MLKGAGGGSAAPATGIQWQNQGSNLGSADASTVNFSTNLTASRSGGTITVVSSGGGSAAPTFVASLTGTLAFANPTSYFNSWTETDVHTSADCHWDGTNKAISFDATGKFEITLRTQFAMSAAANNPNILGSVVDQGGSQEQIASLGFFSNSPTANLTLTDVAVFTASNVGDLATIKAYATAQAGYTASGTVTMYLFVRKVG